MLTRTRLRTTLRTLLTAAGIAGLVLTAGDVVSVAATGRPLVLGTGNSVRGTTTLGNAGSGPALRLRSRPGQAPLAVSSTARVTRLNADLLDGRTAATFARPQRTRDLRYRVTGQSDVLWDARLPTMPAGQYLVTYSAYLDGATGTRADPLKGECYLVQGPGGSPSDQTFYTADDSAVSLGDSMSFSGSGVVDTVQDPRVMLECELNEGAPRSGVSWSTIPAEPIQVTITPLDTYQRTVIDNP